MDRHRSLYKDNASVLSPKNRVNRERNAIRAKQRNDRFHSGRNISVSPTPRKPKSHLLVGNGRQIEENKENTEEENLGAKIPANRTDASMHTSRIAKVACKKDAEKLTRQEMFLQRFIEWKETKKQQEELKKQKQGYKKPFLPYGGSGAIPKTTQAESKNPKPNVTKSFGPQNHQFKAPGGLKTPVNATGVSSETSTVKRKSLYTVVPTPPKKKPDHKFDLKKFPIARKAVPQNHIVSRLRNETTGKPLTSTVEKKSVISKIETNVMGAIKKTPAVSQKPHSNVNTKSTAKIPVTTKPVKMGNHNFAKPRALILPPPEKTGGAVAKAKALLDKKRTVDISKNKKLSVCMKAKKGTSGNSSVSTSIAASKQLSKKLQINKKTLLDVPQQNFPIAETPTDFTNVNSFGSFVTSTTLKSSIGSQNSLNFIKDQSIVDTISPIEPLQNEPEKRDSAVKRMLLHDPESKITKKAPNSGSDKKRKFNFVRYTEASSEMPLENISTSEKEVDKIDAKEEVNKDEANQLQLEQKLDNPQDPPTKTPEKIEEKGDRPINYLSPFVSVTRGKVNSKKEREKRNSIYLLGNQLESETPNICANDVAKREAEIIVRRTLETVRYFRKQLSDEIERLHSLCEKWETYKTENLTRLQETGGEDMINVTIGQTKLLTSKKFMQFSGLIDRCENGAKSEGPVDDGSEDTKAINPVDLEGFWSMVGLQVDNVDKRFQNLERWRTNNWVDPDEVKPKVKKVRKTKAGPAVNAKPNGALQEMLRKAHAEMRQKKAQAAAESAKSGSTEEGDCDIVLTPSHKRRSQNVTPQSHSTTRRKSIIVKNRKLHSAAPTILTINSPIRRVSLSRRTENLPQDSPKLLQSIGEFKRSLTNLQNNSEQNDLWKKALKGADQQRRHAVSVTPPPTNTPEAIKGRKSILKTPGTAKGKPKNVIFNEELRIKKFKFTIDSDCEEDMIDSESDKDKRTYSLRTRKVVLRPSSEFEIPK